MYRTLRMSIIMICLLLMLSTLISQTKNTSAKTTAKPKQPVVTTPKIPVEDILAEYKGGIITKQDLEKKISKLPPQVQGRYKTVEGQIQILDLMTVEDIFFQKAKDLNLLTNPAVLEKTEAAKKQLLIQEYYKRNIAGKVNLTEAEKQEYYQQNQKDYYVMPFITIKYIQTQDQANAKKALAELNKGVPFKTVADKYSIHTYAKSINSTIKSIRNNGYIPGVGDDTELDEIIKNTPVDTLNYTGPNNTITGWSIIQVLERIEGRQRPYLECEAEVDQRLKPIKEAEMLSNLTERLKGFYNVSKVSSVIEQINLREPAQNTEIENLVIVTASDPVLSMTVKSLLEKFNKMSPQEQMMHIKGGGPLQLVNQELQRNLMYLEALKDKSFDEFLSNNDDFQQTKRYHVLQEVYKQIVADLVSVTDEAKRDFYDSRLLEYTTPASRKIQAMWVKDEKTAKKAHKEFSTAVKKNNAKAIAKAMEKYNTKPQMETLDNLYNNGIVTGVGSDQKLSQLIWDTPVGAVSPIAKTIKGEVIIFRVLTENPPLTKSFTEVEPRITAQLKRDSEAAKMEEVKEQLFTQYELKKYPEKLQIKLSADELFDMADNAARQRKYKDAVIFYDQIIQFYPNKSDDYKAFFMKAFLVAEEMGNKELGLSLFKEFLVKYPKGELNESAQYMIDELEGRHPEFEEIELLDDED